MDAFPSPIRSAKRIAILLILLTVVARINAGTGDGHWDRQFGNPGTATANLALRYHDGKIYTGGYGVFAGGSSSNTVVNVFDGTNWSVIEGLNEPSLAQLRDFAFLGNAIYVAGYFTRAGGQAITNLAKWDGANWLPVGGFAGDIQTMTVDGTNLYVAGQFTNAGGVSALNIARWNGTNWSALGSGVGFSNPGLLGPINSMVWHGGQLYVGGGFTNAGGSGITNLAKWNGSSWLPVGGGVIGTSSSPVSTLVSRSNELYVAGTITNVGGMTVSRIAKWDGSSWSTFGSGLNAGVAGFDFLGSNLYAWGSFTNAGGVPAKNFAKWDGVSWSSVGTLTVGGLGYRLASDGNFIYLCGLFNSNNTFLANHIIRFDGNEWRPVTTRPSNGTHFFVFGMHLGSDGLYMGGSFTIVGTNQLIALGRWDGTNWHAVGQKLEALPGNVINVRTIKQRGSEVYVGGQFDGAGGVMFSNIAMWNGANWTALGVGFDDTVLTIDATPSIVYAGGSFTNAILSPGVNLTVNRISQWDGNTWSALGTGLNGTANAICVAGSDVYVGGAFTTAGGATANRIARWDGANWSSLGTGSSNGVGSTVNAILVDGTDVFVGGQFTTAGGTTARGLAKWNGSAWSPVGSGVFASGTASVRALAKSGSYLYVGGTFTNISGLITRCIGRWDGVKWESLGTGIGQDMTSPRVNAIVPWGNDIYIGGSFETVGNIDSGWIARWNDQIDFTPPTTLRLTESQILPNNSFKFRATATSGASYIVDYSTNLTSWSPLLTNSAAFLYVTNAAPEKMRVYRMRETP